MILFSRVPQKRLEMNKNERVFVVIVVQSIPLLYLQYPVDKQGHVWFEKIARTVTNNYIRHIIPIDVQGLNDISYTDCMYGYVETIGYIR